MDKLRLSRVQDTGVMRELHVGEGGGLTSRLNVVPFMGSAMDAILCDLTQNIEVSNNSYKATN
jgi:hypothetical protein